MPKTIRTTQPTPTDPYTNNTNQGSFSISPQTTTFSPQTGFTSTSTRTFCDHQFKVIMINGQYVTYCEKCGKIGDTRNVFSDPSNNYFTTGAPNYLGNPSYAATPTTVTTPNFVPITSNIPNITSKIDSSTIGGINTTLRTDNITF